jgi:hypothetical protein
VQVSVLSGVTAIAAGQYQSLALESDGTVWDWGDNSYGELGNGTTTGSNTPVQVSWLHGVTAIAAGSGHSLALTSNGTVYGTVWSWGLNTSGQLGNGTYYNSRIPVQVSGLSGVTAIAAGEYHSLALNSDGTVSAWGYNVDGELGNNNSNIYYSDVPVQVSGLSGATAIAAGLIHSLALKPIATNAAPSITTTSLPEGAIGTAYSQILSATLGTSPYTWSVTSGSLPPGLTLSGDTISGTPTTAGTSNFDVQLTDNAGNTAIQALSVVIIAAPSGIPGTALAWGDNGDRELGTGTSTSSFIPCRSAGPAGPAC